MSCERIVPTEELRPAGRSQSLLHFNRMMIDGVVEAPLRRALHACEPDYGRDEAFQREYAASAAEPEAWGAFKASTSTSRATTPTAARWPRAR